MSDVSTTDTKTYLQSIDGLTVAIEHERAAMLYARSGHEYSVGGSSTSMLATRNELIRRLDRGLQAYSLLRRHCIRVTGHPHGKEVCLVCGSSWDRWLSHAEAHAEGCILGEPQ